MPKAGNGMSKIVLETKSINKSFPGVKALTDISFDLYEGEIHALVGENGAGKSTLMNILSGVFPHDDGEIFMYGRKVDFKDTKEAYSCGISMIHQELALATSIQVMENVFIGRLLRNKFGFVDFKKMHRECNKLFDKYDIKNINPLDTLKRLSQSQMQLVEIVKALSRNSKILIMDEPTASLTQTEVDSLLSIIKKLKSEGVSIIYISHKLDEVKKISDRITVFRDGKLVKTVDNTDITTKEIANLMVGRDFDETFIRCENCRAEEVVLEVRDLCNKKLKDISFSLRKGEVLCLTGLVGSGRTEVAEAIFGKDSLDKGEIAINGKKTVIKNSRDAIVKGLGLIPEGRKIQGLFLNRSVKENISIVSLQKNKFFINDKAERESVLEIKEKLKVKTPTLNQQIRFLSGGNQQKAIIGRCLLNEPNILILDEPTHGVDVGAKMEIYKIIDDLVNSGVSIILISSELPEVMMLSDRVIVMHEGEIKGILSKQEVSQEKIMMFATNQQA
jgi:ABC-type sugar transport system ATPase subunit